MKATELRIGNLCYYRIIDSLDERKEWDEINTIDVEDISAIQNIKTKEYTPIPITEEWLVRFGFKKHRSDFYIMLDTPDFHLNLMISKDGFYPSIEQTPEFASEDVQICYLNKIEYVHQIQNLFFTLTGKELTYTL